VEELLILGADASKVLEAAIPTYLELEKPKKRVFIGMKCRGFNVSFVFT